MLQAYYIVIKYANTHTSYRIQYSDLFKAIDDIFKYNCDSNIATLILETPKANLDINDIVAHDKAARDYAEQEELYYLDKLSSIEYSDPAEKEAAKDVYEEAYLKYISNQ